MAETDSMTNKTAVLVPDAQMVDKDSWLNRAGAQWVDGRAPSPLGLHLDVTDLAIDLVNFCAETASDSHGGAMGGAVDRKPHLQRMSVDFGGARHDTGASTRLGGCRTQAMLAGKGPGARGLRRWWELLEAAVAATCAESQLIQMFPMVATGQGPGAVTGEPHVDMIQSRETRNAIGARGTVHLTAQDSAAREFRVAPVELTASGDKTLRVAEHCLQARERTFSRGLNLNHCVAG